MLARTPYTRVSTISGYQSYEQVEGGLQKGFGLALKNASPRLTTYLGNCVLSFEMLDDRVQTYMHCQGHHSIDHIFCIVYDYQVFKQESKKKGVQLISDPKLRKSLSKWRFCVLACPD